MTDSVEPPRTRPRLRLLSLGAGVQSTAVLLLACEGEIPPFDYAVFANTGWEPRAVYENLTRLRNHAARYGIPVRTVSAGDIRADALDASRRFASMPLHVLKTDGTKGLGRRQCSVICTSISSDPRSCPAAQDDGCGAARGHGSAMRQRGGSGGG